MADEDALFAEFMGEIKSAVVEPAPVVGEDGGDAPDAASVGDVGEEEGRGEAVVDTSKRKGGEVCMVCTNHEFEQRDTRQHVKKVATAVGYHRRTYIPLRKALSFGTG